jgi:hypothetical protein
MENDQAPGLEAKASRAENHRRIGGVSTQGTGGANRVRRWAQGSAPSVTSQLFLDSNLNSSSCGPGADARAPRHRLSERDPRLYWLEPSQGNGPTCILRLNDPATLPRRWRGRERGPPAWVSSSGAPPTPGRRPNSGQASMTKIALPTAALVLGALLAGCAQHERPPAVSGTSGTAQPMPSGSMQPMAAPGTPQPVAPGAAQPMSGVYGSGTSVPPVDMNTQQLIRNRLADDGYTEVSNLQRDAGGYTASAVKDGKVVEVMIDATGKVTRMR